MKMGVSIWHGSDLVTQEQNVQGVMTPILEVEPETGTVLAFKNRIDQGTEKGIPVYAILEDSGGNALPINTAYEIQLQTPADQNYRSVSERVGNIRNFNNKTISEQQSEEQIDTQKIELDGAEVRVRGRKDTLAFAIQSSEQVDWSNSELYFEEAAVEERTLEA